MMMDAQGEICSYGSWKSPVTASQIASSSVSFQELICDGKDLYLTETRPREKGRSALVKRSNDQWQDFCSDASLRTRVHEYGGGCLTAGRGKIYFTNDKDKGFYSLDAQGKLQLLIAQKNLRFADGCVSPDQKSLFLVCEQHHENHQVDNYLVQLSLDEKGALQIIASGHDFYAAPRVSEDGKYLAFIAWDFPNMPWDGTTLYRAEIQKEGSLAHIQKIAGGEEESICQIQWASNGDLYFVSDRTGFWNLYRFKKGEIEPLHPMQAEFGIPAWVFGKPTYAFIPNKKSQIIASVFCEKGIDKLGLIYSDEKRFEVLNLPFTVIQNVIYGRDKLYFFGASPTLALSLISLDLTNGTYEILKESMPCNLKEEAIAPPELIEFSSKEGKTAYAFYYAPKNPHFQGPKTKKPPLIVKCHGGPTSRSSAALNYEIQYWTSRGFAFVDVNYAGSSGYGRDYLKRLEGNWGILDVADCVHAAQFLARRGSVDEKSLFIRGGSAGGFTTLCALASTHVFAGGASYYGVSDLELLAKETHKFESNYLEKLIGPYPEKKELYVQRSPIHHADQIKNPLLLLQGKEDPVVPMNQAMRIYEAVKKNKTSVCLLLFDQEMHGFRQAATIQKALEAEYFFYCKILNVTPADPIEPLSIDHFTESQFHGNSSHLMQNK